MKTIKTLIITLALIAILAGAMAAIADSGSLSASFMANVNTGAAPLTVHFTDKSEGRPTGWQWDFGDGSNSTLRNPVYTYNTPGTYTVTLTATDGTQSDTVSADIVVTNPLAITPTPSPTRIPVVVQPILVPVKDPHYGKPHHPDKPVKDQPVKDQPVHKQPTKKPTEKPTPKPADKPRHK